MRKINMKKLIRKISFQQIHFRKNRSTVNVKTREDNNLKPLRPREMDVNERKLAVSFVPRRGHLLETVMYNRIRHFGGTFKYEWVYQSYFLTNRLDILHEHTLTCLPLGNKKIFHVALTKVIWYGKE